MKKFSKIFNVTSLMLVLATTMSLQNCIMIFGQDNLPDELIE